MAHTEESKRKIAQSKLGIPRPDHVKEAISQKNKYTVRGIKLIKDDEVKKVPYNEVEYHINDGWDFKSERIWMNNGERHVTKSVKKWKQLLDEGWKFGTLTELNKPACYHCGQRDCNTNHYAEK